MHPVIIRQLAADHIREIHAKAADERLARQARRGRHRAPSTSEVKDRSALSARPDPGRESSGIAVLTGRGR